MDKLAECRKRLAELTAEHTAALEALLVRGADTAKVAAVLPESPGGGLDYGGMRVRDFVSLDEESRAKIIEDLSKRLANQIPPSFNPGKPLPRFRLFGGSAAKPEVSSDVSPGFGARTKSLATNATRGLLGSALNGVYTGIGNLWSRFGKG